MLSRHGHQSVIVASIYNQLFGLILAHRLMCRSPIALRLLEASPVTVLVSHDVYELVQPLLLIARLAILLRITARNLLLRLAVHISLCGLRAKVERLQVHVGVHLPRIQSH